MSDYTILNIAELENMAAKFGRKGYEARFVTKPLGLEKSGLGYQKLEPNYRFDFGHTHDTQEEVFVVVAGSGRVKLDDDIKQLKQWDAVRIPGPVMRCFEAGPEGMELLIFGAPFVDSSDVQMTKEWWSDVA